MRVVSPENPTGRNPLSESRQIGAAGTGRIPGPVEPSCEAHAILEVSAATCCAGVQPSITTESQPMSAKRIEKEIEVKVPLNVAYNQWTQFETFPEFMEGVKEVRQLDDRRLFWRAIILGREVEWQAEIFEQVPD